jgi:hypothetical protein
MSNAKRLSKLQTRALELIKPGATLQSVIAELCITNEQLYEWLDDENFAVAWRRRFTIATLELQFTLLQSDELALLALQLCLVDNRKNPIPYLQLRGLIPRAAGDEARQKRRRVKAKASKGQSRQANA